MSDTIAPGPSVSLGITTALERANEGQPWRRTFLPFSLVLATDADRWEKVDREWREWVRLMLPYRDLLQGLQNIHDYGQTSEWEKDLAAFEANLKERNRV